MDAVLQTLDFILSIKRSHHLFFPLLIHALGTKFNMRFNLASRTFSISKRALWNFGKILINWWGRRGEDSKNISHCKIKRSSYLPRPRFRFNSASLASTTSLLASLWRSWSLDAPSSPPSCLLGRHKNYLKFRISSISKTHIMVVYRKDFYPWR